MRITNVTTIALFLPSLNKTVEAGDTLDVPDSMASDFKNHALFSVDQSQQSQTNMAQEPQA